MKRNNNHIITCCLMLLLFLTACERYPWISPEGEHEASLVLNIGTRAITPGDGNAAKGGGMNDLIVFLVDNDMDSNNKVQAVSSISNLSSSKRQIINFDNIALGSYAIYAFANYSGNSIFSGTVFASLQKGDSFTQAMADAAFASLSGTATPDAMFRSSDGAMLLTACKKIEIKLGSNTAIVEMLRPLVHFLVELNNHSNHQMMVNQSSLSFSNFNASTSYVVAHDNMNTGTHRALPAKNAEIEIPAHESATVYECYLYENQANAYNFGMDVNMWSNNTLVFAGNTISYSRNGRTYYLVNNNGELDLTTTYSSNCLWNIVPTSEDNNNDTYYVMSDVGTAPYLSLKKSGTRYSVDMSTNSNNSTKIELNIPAYKSDQDFESTIGYRSWNRYVYGNNSGALSASSSSRTWSITRVYAGTTSGYQKIASFQNRQLYKVNATTGEKSNLSEMRRNTQVKVTLNAYYNELSGEFNYAVEAWESCTNNIEFN